MKYVYQELTLNNKTKIVIGSSCCPLQELLLFCKVDVMFVDKHRSFIFGHDVAITIAEDFIAHLIYTTQQKLTLDESCHNIGFVANEYHRAFWGNKKNDTRRLFKEDDNNFWIGYQYQLFGSKNKTGWLYNDQYGNIIFEIAPYFNTFIRNKKTYLQWIKQYKSIFRCTIAQDVALKWIDQLRKVLLMIRVNSKLDLEYDFMTYRRKE